MSEHTQKPKVVFLAGEKISLRPLEERDLERIVVWINDPEVRKYLSSYLPMTMTQEKKWLEHLSGNEKEIVLAVVDNESGECIGNTGIHGIKNGRSGSATFGFMIGDKSFWGKGYGTEILDLMLRYAFHTLGLRKMKSSALAPNIGSRRVHEKCGFKEVGSFEKEYLVDGEYVDEILLEVFREDWEKKQS